jgi:hypothetical protein
LASQETHCFEATIYVDGKRFCQVSNDGHGGCDNYHAIKSTDGSVYNGVKAINKKLAVGPRLDSKWSDEGLENNLEIVVCNLVNKWLQDKEIKTVLRRISYIKNGGLYQIQAKHKPTPHNIEALMTASWWKPEYVMVSGKSVEEARAVLATINFFGEL